MANLAAPLSFPPPITSAKRQGGGGRPIYQPGAAAAAQSEVSAIPETEIANRPKGVERKDWTNKKPFPNLGGETRTFPSTPLLPPSDRRKVNNISLSVYPGGICEAGPQRKRRHFSATHTKKSAATLKNFPPPEFSPSSPFLPTAHRVPLGIDSTWR